MKLELKLRRGGPGDSGTNPDDYFAKQVVHSREIGGDLVEYVFASRAFFEDNEVPLEMGYSTEENLFMAKDVLPVCLPFVLMKLYAEQQKAGSYDESTLELADGLFAASLKVASDLLRPIDIGWYIERIEQAQPGFVERTHGELLEVVEAYHPDNTVALVRRNQASRPFYEQEIGLMLDNHHHNKHIRTSRILENSPSWVRKGAEAYIIEADKTMKEINGEVDAVVALQFVRKMRDSEEPVVIGPEESRVAYACTNQVTKRNYVQFLDSADVEAKHNLVARVPNRFTTRFWDSLEKRLNHVASQALKEVNEGYIQLCKTISESRQLYSEATKPGATKRSRAQAASPAVAGAMIEAERNRQEIEEGKNKLSDIVTAAPEEVSHAADLISLQQHIERVLGKADPEVEEEITKHVNSGYLGLKKVVSTGHLLE